MFHQLMTRANISGISIQSFSLWLPSRTDQVPPPTSVNTFFSEAVVQKCSVKKVFLEIFQNSQENTCARVSFLIKLQACVTLLKKRLWHRCFPVNFAKFLRTPFFTEHLRWLLLFFVCLFVLLIAI